MEQSTRTGSRRGGPPDPPANIGPPTRPKKVLLCPPCSFFPCDSILVQHQQRPERSSGPLRMQTEHT